MLVLSGLTVATPANAAVPFAVASLDGSGNNVANPTWGQSGRAYARIGPVRYADGIGSPVSGPNSRYISNRVHNDIAQNIFSERHLTAWAWTWGQFLDHTFGLRESTGSTATAANIPFNTSDPLEQFTNNLGVIPFTRSAATTGTGTSTANPRQQTNTENSYIDAEAVYGGSNTRLDWLRAGSLDGNPTNNSASLLLTSDGYLPTKNARGNPSAAPAMDVDGRLIGNPNNARVAGDPRANENMNLTATQTLFAREHNRIVSLLPSTLSEEDKFQIARRVVVAEQQYITYNEFLPAFGISLPAYTGYNSTVNANLSNEFATIGYRAHSQIHGEIEVEADADRYTQAQLDAIEAQGIEVTVDGDEVEFVLPLGVAFFNPDLVNMIGEGPVLEGIGGEAQYKNEEMIDNQLRSTLFQIPVSGNPECLDGPTLPQCFQGVVDLGAIDIERDRDHGLPTYNQLRQLYGLPQRTSFTQITGESTSAFPAGSGIDNPNNQDFTSLKNLWGEEIDRNDPVQVDADVVNTTKRSTLAARLQAIYGNVNNIDGFIGMLAEPHIAGTEFGELQRAMWTREFQRLRDGDRFFYGNDQGLTFIKNTYNIDFKKNLGDIIAANSDIPRADLAPNVFFTHGDVPPTSCRVQYTITTTWPGNFQVNMRLFNTGTTPINNWTLRYSFANGQTISNGWAGTFTQTAGRIGVENAANNGAIPAGGSMDGIGFNATRGTTNAVPTNFSLNTTPCSTG
ncbi:cellulose binding domain-containing protein [Streptosporangiaceae bacterium NEAU-GS5]|nr:cellulose binding domain-containing protein [Streptosporangiaceae bacterium NEAU-GS5]